MALFHLNDAAAPIGHTVRDHHVLHDARLQTVAQFVDRGLAHGRVDVVIVEHMHAKCEDDRLGRGLAHGDGGDVESRRLVGLAHIAGPFRVEMVAALYAGLFSLFGFEAAVARIDVAFEHDFAIGQRHRIDGARLDQTNRRTLHRRRDPDLVAAHRQDRIVESRAGQ